MNSISEVLVEISNKCKQIADEKEKDRIMTEGILSYINNNVLCQKK